MREMIDATWRAAAYCLHPVTLLWSLLPLGLMATAVFGLGWFWWEPSVAGVRNLLGQGDLLAALFDWLMEIFSFQGISDQVAAGYILQGALDRLAYLEG